MKVIELKINDSELSGWNGVALVEMPAIQENFIAFNKQDKPEITENNIEEIILENILLLEFVIEEKDMHDDTKKFFDAQIPNKFSQELAEKQMIIAPIMRADFMIPRIDKDGNEYEVFFSADTIKAIAYKAMKENKVHNVNIEHDPKQSVDGVYMTETWLVEDPEKDKSTLYGFSPNKGDWYGMYKIDNKEVWNTLVKTGKVKGVSIEGWFLQNLIN